jgi:hypothetical protein
MFTEEILDNPTHQNKEKAIQEILESYRLENIQKKLKVVNKKQKKAEKRIENIEGNVSAIQKNQTNAIEKIDCLEENVSQVQSQLVRVDQNLKSWQGSINASKGIKKQNQITKQLLSCMKKEQGIFSGYSLVGDPHTITLKEKNSQGFEIDIYAALKDKKTGKKYGLLVEVKDRNKPISSTEAQKLLEASKMAQNKYKLEGLMVMYISEKASFSKPAQEILTKARVMYGTRKSVFGAYLQKKS